MKYKVRLFLVLQLPYSLDWQTLKSKFQNVGEIRFAEISKNDKGRSNGWGLVSFRRESDALQAVRKYYTYKVTLVIPQLMKLEANKVSRQLVGLLVKCCVLPPPTDFKSSKLVTHPYDG